MAIELATPALPLRIDGDGVVRVGGTRVTLETIVRVFLEGNTAEEIADQFPTVKLSDVYATIAYYLDHRPDVDAYLAQVLAEEEAVRLEVERRRPSHELRDRLLRRRPPS